MKNLRTIEAAGFLRHADLVESDDGYPEGSRSFLYPEFEGDLVVVHAGDATLALSDAGLMPEEWEDEDIVAAGDVVREDDPRFGAVWWQIEEAMKDAAEHVARREAG